MIGEWFAPCWQILWRVAPDWLVYWIMYIKILIMPHISCPEAEAASVFESSTYYHKTSSVHVHCTKNERVIRATWTDSLPETFIAQFRSAIISCVRICSGGRSNQLNGSIKPILLISLLMGKSLRHKWNYPLKMTNVKKGTEVRPLCICPQSVSPNRWLS